MDPKSPDQNPPEMETPTGRRFGPRTYRMLGLLVLLILIVIAAVVYGPAPGDREPDPATGATVDAELQPE